MKTPSILLLCLLACGCPGKASFPRADGKAVGGEPSFTPLPDGPPPTMPDQASADRGADDFFLNTAVGGPCPCAAPLLCVLKACRKPCSQVICNGATDCSAAETCVNTEANTPVCVPGAATGQPCSKDALCAAGNLCMLTTGSAVTGKCHATCAGTGQPCAGQSSCTQVKDSACFFCP